MHKLHTGFSLILVSLLVLVGCGGSEEELPHESSEQTPAPAQVDASVVVEEQAEPLNVMISTSVSLRSDRRLMVEGETNLPDSAQVQIVVERELSRVRWQSRTAVSDGRFSAGPFGSGSGLPDGGYMVRVQLSEASVQPVAVQKRIGEKGEHLAGELVSQSRHGLGQVATYSRRFLVGDEPRRTRDQVEVH
ncbi:hypothetical protein [Vreelandella nanhaiensis]|uniref:Uncharacterized protein n=1 Tax=Vreelandella nanhaiensis TaxID=1258546 RepID=A0A433KV77_9GAMM|nr:hypothetical protein [Halomonas nanhaiensis]RUR33593.1 hypothetical protein ELY38_03985 [Halomonas nanhaiensis]